MLKKILLIFFIIVINLCVILAFDEKLDNAQKKTNWQPYLKEAEVNIKQNWHPPQFSESIKIVVLFNINKSGKLTSYKLIEPSPCDECNQAAIQAIKDTRFKPLPKNYKGKSVPVEFTFDYNVINSK